MVFRPLVLPPKKSNVMGTPYILYAILLKTIQGLFVLHSRGQSVKEVSSLSLSLLRWRESREAAKNQNDQWFAIRDWIESLIKRHATTAAQIEKLKGQEALVRAKDLFSDKQSELDSGSTEFAENARALNAVRAALRAHHTYALKALDNSTWTAS